MGLKRLSPRHKEIMRRMLLGQKQIDIAREMGMNQPSVSVIVNSTRFRQALAAMEGSIEQLFVEGIVDKELNDPVRRRLHEVKEDAINEMVSLMQTAESETVRRASAADILDRAGYKPREIVEQQHSFNVDQKMSEDISRALEDLGVEGIDDIGSPDFVEMPSFEEEEDEISEEEYNLINNWQTNSSDFEPVEDEKEGDLNGTTESG